MNFKFNLNYELDLTIKVKAFIPARPAPLCSNTNDPKYSDDGDHAEWGEAIVLLNGHDITKFLPDGFIAEIRDDIIEKGESEMLGFIKDRKIK